MIITDDLKMMAIRLHYNMKKAVVKAIEAGNDIIMIGMSYKKLKKIINYVVKEVKDGKIDIKELRKQRYNLDDLMSQLHQNNIQSIKEVSYAFIEDNGQFCVISKKNKIVKCPELMIIDGKINDDYLKLSNKKKEDVIRLINEKGYHRVEEIFLAQELIDELYIIPFEKLE